MRVSHGVLNRKKRGKILSGKGNDWSRESAAVMEDFLRWLTVSNIEKTQCLNRINGKTFQIVFHNDNSKNEIILTDEAGYIGMPFLWDKESGIERRYYLIDAGFLLFYIGSLCHNEHSVKKINDFICANIM